MRLVTDEELLDSIPVLEKTLELLRIDVEIDRGSTGESHELFFDLARLAAQVLARCRIVKAPEGTPQFLRRRRQIPLADERFPLAVHLNPLVLSARQRIQMRLV